jgi:hypothetical protein
VAGMTGLTTGFGFDRSALKVETVGLIRALFTRARRALAVAADARVTSGALHL